MVTLSLLQIIIFSFIVSILVVPQIIAGLWCLTKFGFCSRDIWPKWVPFGEIIQTTKTDLLVMCSIVFLIFSIIKYLS
jgi:hypothetical protein